LKKIIIPIAIVLVIISIWSYSQDNISYFKNPKLDPNVTYESIIPVVDYESRGYEGIGKLTTPQTAALACLAWFDVKPFSLIKTQYDPENGVYIADWLEKQGEYSSDYIIFRHNFHWPSYELPPGWVSGLTQGTVAECFLVAYDYTSDQKYLDLAKKSLYALAVPIDEGGILIDEGNNKWWYEAYASPDSKRSFVLNGHMFSLISLHKYLEYDNDEKIQQLFDNGLIALKETGPLYDNGYHSFYDRLNNTASTYHIIHGILFYELYELTNDEELLELHQLFTNSSMVDDLVSTKTYDNLVLSVDYGEKFGGIGKQYPFVEVARKCLQFFPKYNIKEGDTGMYIANWLIEFAEDKGNYIIFSHPYNFYYDTHPGWKSGLAQGRISECFLGAYSFSGDQKYLDLAKKSLYALAVPIDEGGILIDEGDNKWWYETYADLESQRSYVLNGHMLTLISLDQFLMHNKFEKDEHVQELFDNGLNALKEDAMLYDKGFNETFTDRLGHFDQKFHERNLVLFDKLYEITGDEKLTAIKAKFLN